MFLIVLVIVLVVAFAALMFARDLNEILGREPERIRHAKGKRRRSLDQYRVACPKCATKVPTDAKICPFCKSEIGN